MRELVFDIIQESDGGYCAEALGEGIFTQGHSWQELRENILDATQLHFHDQPDKPTTLRLYFRRDEIIPLTNPAWSAPPPPPSAH